MRLVANPGAYPVKVHWVFRRWQERVVQDLCSGGRPHDREELTFEQAMAAEYDDQWQITYGLLPSEMETLAAILAQHERMIRAQVGSEIRESIAKGMPGENMTGQVQHGLELAVHIARGRPHKRSPSNAASRNPKISLEALYVRDGGMCQICGKLITMRLATRDHIVPLSKGGSRNVSNIQLACKPCNKDKDDSMPEEENHGGDRVVRLDGGADFPGPDVVDGEVSAGEE